MLVLISTRRMQVELSGYFHTKQAIEHCPAT
jgi:hypothetical protein